MLKPEGVIKFHDVWQQGPLPDSPLLWELCRWRNLLFRCGLIGATDGVGYGNLSVRCGEGVHFFITGSGTGCLPELRPEHCAEVFAVDIEHNRLFSRGLVRASSESLSHAALYRSSPLIGAVLHVHHHGLWQRLRGRVPTTEEHYTYGTPELALALQSLYHRFSLGQRGLIVMGGHPDGLLSFGATLEEVASLVLEALQTEGLPPTVSPGYSAPPEHLPGGNRVPDPRDSAPQ